MSLSDQLDLENNQKGYETITNYLNDTNIQFTDLFLLKNYIELIKESISLKENDLVKEVFSLVNSFEDLNHVNELTKKLKDTSLINELINLYSS